MGQKSDPALHMPKQVEGRVQLALFVLGDLPGPALHSRSPDFTLGSKASKGISSIAMRHSGDYQHPQPLEPPQELVLP